MTATELYQAARRAWFARSVWSAELKAALRRFAEQVLTASAEAAR